MELQLLLDVDVAGCIRLGSLSSLIPEFFLFNDSASFIGISLSLI